MTRYLPFDKTETDHPSRYAEPRILAVIDDFLTKDKIFHYQSLMTDGWTLGHSIEFFKYVSKDLYNHYQWNDDWSAVAWRNDCSPDWETLYHEISQHLPRHRVHWIDLKITPPLSSGTPLHRDRDPWSEPELAPNTCEQFCKALTVVCNLNSQWHKEWGGDFVIHQAFKKKAGISFVEKHRIPIRPGQLLIAENCYHSIDPVIKPERNRMSFILHVLQYK